MKEKQSYDLVPIGFPEIELIVSRTGTGRIGYGVGRGSNRAEIAAREAIRPFSFAEDRDVATAIHISGSPDMTLSDTNKVMDAVYCKIPFDAGNIIIFGSRIDSTLADEIRVTIIVGN